jgi:acetyl esterase/lipase
VLGRINAVRNVPVLAVDADVSVRLHRPARLADPAPALLWIHGGGFVMAARDRKMASAASCLI